MVVRPLASPTAPALMLAGAHHTVFMCSKKTVPHVICNSSSFHAADESKYERDVRAEFDAAAEEVDVYDCGSAPCMRPG